jgi:cell division protein FtsL
MKLSMLLSTLAVVLSLLVVLKKHEHRKLVNESEQLRRQADALEIEWGQLLLEKATYSTHDRVEKQAREGLGMVSPIAPQWVEQP